MNIIFYILIFNYNLLSPLGILLILLTRNYRSLKKFFYTLFICLVPLYNFIIKGLLINFYNGSIELIFYSIYILSFTLFDNIKYDIYKSLNYIRERKVKINTILITSLLLVYLIPFLSPIRDTLCTIVIISEFSKCLLLANGLIKKESSISYLDIFPICYILLEIFIADFDNTSPTILACSYFISLVLLRLKSLIKKTLFNFKLSKIGLLISFSITGIIMIIINNENLINLFYKFQYIYQSASLILANGDFDLMYLYEFSVSRIYDSVLYRIAEALNIIFNIFDEERYFGSLVTTNTISGIIGHFPQVTLFFKYGIYSISTNIILLLDLFKVQSHHKNYKMEYSLIPLLPILISDSQGEFVSSFFFGAALFTFKEYLCIKFNKLKNFFLNV